MIHNITQDFYSLGLHNRLSSNKEDQDNANRFFRADIHFAGKFLQLLNFEEIIKPAFFYLCSWWDNGWNVQTAVYFAINGIMNGGMGGNTPTIMAGRFLPNLKEDYVEYFENEHVKDMLTNRRYKGPVSFGFSEDGHLVSLTSGFPFFAAYLWLSGLKNTTLPEYIKDPMSHDLFESWTVGNLVSVAPFPYSFHSSPRPTNVEVSHGKDFWSFLQNGTPIKGIIGISVGSDILLHNAVSKCIDSCLDVKCPEVQFRTDLEKVILSDHWPMIRSCILDKI